MFSINENFATMLLKCLQTRSISIIEIIIVTHCPLFLHLFYYPLFKIKECTCCFTSFISNNIHDDIWYAHRYIPYSLKERMAQHNYYTSEKVHEHYQFDCILVTTNDTEYGQLGTQNYPALRTWQ